MANFTFEPHLWIDYCCVCVRRKKSYLWFGCSVLLSHRLFCIIIFVALSVYLWGLVGGRWIWPLASCSLVSFGMHQISIIARREIIFIRCDFSLEIYSKMVLRWHVECSWAQRHFWLAGLFSFCINIDNVTVTRAAHTPILSWPIKFYGDSIYWSFFSDSQINWNNEKTHKTHAQSWRTTKKQHPYATLNQQSLYIDVVCVCWFYNVRIVPDKINIFHEKNIGRKSLLDHCFRLNVTCSSVMMIRCVFFFCSVWKYLWFMSSVWLSQESYPTAYFVYGLFEMAIPLINDEIPVNTSMRLHQRTFQSNVVLKCSVCSLVHLEIESCQCNCMTNFEN